MSKMNGNATAHNVSKIDAIKEIIFGQTMHDYDKRFSNLEALLISNHNDLKKTTQQKINALHQELESHKAEADQKRKKLEAKITKQIKLLDDKKVEIAVIKKHLVQLIESL